VKGFLGYFTAEPRRTQSGMFGKTLSKIRKKKTASKAGKPYVPSTPLSFISLRLCG